jgi:hypothetical protein
MSKIRRLAALLTVALLWPTASGAFCGFYVAKADAKLWNKASKVVLVRDGDRTVLTMASDYEGEPSEFALVVPVPVVLKREQIHVANPEIVKHLDDFTAPRLVEYYDEDPCAERVEVMTMAAQAPNAMPSLRRDNARSRGVTIEAEYTVEEYDILILSAKESGGLATWLRENGYRIPDGAEAVLDSYLKQGLRFFVAKVNLDEKARLGVRELRPLQMAFETPRFGLPIRLGTLNARGEQDLLVFALTRAGRVEAANYRTVRIPSNLELPPFVEQKFADFYRDMFARTRAKAGPVVITEHAWDIGWCDPCSAEPLAPGELRELGVFWLASAPEPSFEGQRLPLAPFDVGLGSGEVFVTRLHVRYDARSFPEDLAFQITGDRENFQGRYVIRHPWLGSAQCGAATRYRFGLRRRQEQEASTLADSTGWDLARIRAQQKLPGDAPRGDAEPWWQRLWPGGL